MSDNVFKLVPKTEVDEQSQDTPDENLVSMLTTVDRIRERIVNGEVTDIAIATVTTQGVRIVFDQDLTRGCHIRLLGAVDHLHHKLLTAGDD